MIGFDVPVVHTEQRSEEYNDEAYIKDDGGPITFRWIFPKGTLDKRMSGFELAHFIIFHMPRILPMFAHHPRIQLEFAMMLYKFLFMSKDALDEVLPWVQSVTREEHADIIVLSLNEKQTNTRKTAKVFY